MNSYKVIWAIDIEADSHQEAAEIALDIQRDPDSIATIFEVTDTDNKEAQMVDSGREGIVL